METQFQQINQEFGIIIITHNNEQLRLKTRPTDEVDTGIQRLAHSYHHNRLVMTLPQRYNSTFEEELDCITHHPGLSSVCL